MNFHQLILYLQSCIFMMEMGISFGDPAIHQKMSLWCVRNNLRWTWKSERFMFLLFRWNKSSVRLKIAKRLLTNKWMPPSYSTEPKLLIPCATKCMQQYKIVCIYKHDSKKKHSFFCSVYTYSQNAWLNVMGVYADCGKNRMNTYRASKISLLVRWKS